MNRLISILTALLLTASLLAGCGRSGNDAAATPADAESPAAEGTADSASQTPASTVESLEYWVSWTPGGGTEAELIKAFQTYEEMTGTKINYSQITYDMMHDKLVTTASAGNMPDVAWGLPEWIGEFNSMGMLSDLSEPFENWSDKDVIFESIVDAFTVNGKLLGVPYEMVLRALLVHDDILAEAGVEIPKTWDDLLALGDFQATHGKYPFEFTGTSVRGVQELLIYLAQSGVEIASEQPDGGYKNTWLDDPDQLAAATETFQFYRSLLDLGIVDPSAKAWGWEETDTNFATGLVALHQTGNWMREREEINPTEMADVTVHPIPYNRIPATYIEAKPQFVFENGTDLQAKFDFVTFICSKEVQEIAFTNRSGRSDVFEDSKWSRDFSALADTGVVFPPITLGSITIAMEDSIARVTQNNEEPEAVATWLANQINDSLRQNGELSE